MGSEVSGACRRALDFRSERLIALAQREWTSWPDALLVEWDQERRLVAARHPALTPEEAGWVAWARTRLGFTTARGLCLQKYRRGRAREGREAGADPGATAAA